MSLETGKNGALKKEPSRAEDLTAVKEINGFSLQDVGEFGKVVEKVDSPVAVSETPGPDLKDRIKACLVAGATNRQTAEALGVQESYVAQLRTNENFESQIIAARATKRSKINDGYDELELDLLGKLKDTMDLPMKPHEILRALQVVGARKREPVLPDQDGANQGGGKTIVQLHLNPVIAAKFILDPLKKDIIGVGGQVFAPMPSAALLSEARASLAGPSGTEGQTKVIEHSPAVKEGEKKDEELHTQKSG